jgi:serine/threonine protein kinase
LEPLGRGGFGVVFKAYQVAFQRHVAVKVVQTSTSDAKRRFARECRTAGALSNHPNVVPLYDAGFTEEGQGFILMPYLSRGSLGQLLRDEGPCSSGEAVDHAVRVCGALETAHRGEILHRDVKPDNILFSSHGEAQLSDFGMAILGKEGSATPVYFAGTPSYAAPEVLVGEPPSMQSDLYAVAATVYRAVTGSPPFTAPASVDPYQIYRAIIDQDLRPHPGLPEDLFACLGRALAKDPAERYGAVLDFAVQLQDWQAAHGHPPTHVTVLETVSSAAAQARTVDAVTNEDLQVPSGLLVLEPHVAPSSSGSSTRALRDRSRRLWVVIAGVLALGAVIASVLFALDLGPFAQDSSQGWTAAAASASDPSGVERASRPLRTEARPRGEDQGEARLADLRQYVRFDGTAPVGTQQCGGVLGLCLSSPSEQAAQMLGVEDRRFSLAADMVMRQWGLNETVTITTREDSIGSIRNIAVTTNESAIQDVRVALPDGLVLGMVTMADIRSRWPQGSWGKSVMENYAFYSYEFNAGPEGTEIWQFGYHVAIDGDDPGGFNRVLFSRPVLSFSVESIAG